MILGDVTAVSLVVDAQNFFDDTVGLDNFAFVPEPASFLLVATGFARLRRRPPRPATRR